MNLSVLRWIGVSGFLLLCGCGDAPPRVLPDQPDPQSGEVAMKQYDANRDGALDATELEKTPGLKAALNQVDTNHDGKITAAEITARLKSWADSQVGRMSINCVITRNGQPLSGVQVQCVPEPFLGNSLKSATGTSDKNGMASLNSANEGDAIGGVGPGFYRVVITSNTETLPPHYNTATTLGVEVANDSPALSAGPIPFALH